MKITTPINVSGTAAAFTTEYKGKFKTGCPMKAEQVVQILQFDEAGQKVVKWTEYAIFMLISLSWWSVSECGSVGISTTKRFSLANAAAICGMSCNL